jgi:hypothetical protein
MDSKDVSVTLQRSLFIWLYIARKFHYNREFRSRKVLKLIENMPRVKAKDIRDNLIYDQEKYT